jgi:riboflavin kinase / FMN adenylyltransferase
MAEVKQPGSDQLPVVLSGTVTRFRGNGRRLGFPTANFKTDTKLADGVYFGYATLGKFKVHPAIIFIGTPTTLWDVGRRVEAFLIDIPDLDYYSLELTVDIRTRHRGNHTFDSIEDLVSAMRKDELAARDWFQSREP